MELQAADLQDMSALRLLFVSMSVEVVVRRFQYNRHVDFQQRLTKRVSFLHVPKLHLTDTLLRLVKRLRKFRIKGECCARIFECVTPVQMAGNFTRNLECEHSLVVLCRIDGMLPESLAEGLAPGSTDV